MKKLLTVLTLLISRGVYAQQAPNPYADSIMKHARRMASLLESGDYNAYAKYVPATLIHQFGTKDMFVAHIRKGVLNTIEGNASFTLVNVGKPSDLIDTAGFLQCTLSETVSILVGDDRLEAVSTLLALSPDKGRHWLFVNLSGPEELVNVRSILHYVSSKVQVPEHRLRKLE